MATSNEEDDDIISKEITQQVEDLSINNNDMLTTCANCGKQGNNINNMCNKCKGATYCNASCKKKQKESQKFTGGSCVVLCKYAMYPKGEFFSELSPKNPLGSSRKR